jgi:hypothetical protein
MAYLLEVHCLLRYEASQDLRDRILNNWLVNITGDSAWKSSLKTGKKPRLDRTKTGKDRTSSPVF